MGKTYAILGSGMQGTCAAYDLALYGDADRILMGDIFYEQAEKASKRVNLLVSKGVCEPHRVNALDEDSLTKFLEPVDVVLSCVPYWMHPHIAPVAIKTLTSMVDMGGDTEVTLETMKLDEAAKAAKVSIVPDCGLAPGLVNSLATYLMAKFDEVYDVKLYCGGLPQHPKPPFYYKLSFNIEGLVAEYTDEAFAIRDYKLVRLKTLEDLETVQWEGLGQLEAFVTSGGTSTAPWTFEGKVRTYEYKTLRFPGHCEKMRIFLDCGFWSKEPIQVKGVTVIPVDVFCAIMGPKLQDPEDKDQVLVRAIVTGLKNGKEERHEIEIHDFHDDETDFSAMERMTGFPTSIVAIEIAKGNIPHGCIRYELAMPGEVMVRNLLARSIKFKEDGIILETIPAKGPTFEEEARIHKS
ncbi:MAG TPA: saccharopine dehydrogenase C-terminal domain-containing protein [Fimbriimonadales bacterium]|nr:saccharopine dehydrogenase C-terminal domain-containing protein [Fimbriimonadales bacterium]